MLFTQFNLEDAKKIWYEEAFEDGEKQGEGRGLANGRYQGEIVKMIKQIQRKLQKGKILESIAEELEESLELENVERICKAVNKCGLEVDAMDIYEEIQNIAPAQ